MGMAACRHVVRLFCLLYLTFHVATAKPVPPVNATACECPLENLSNGICDLSEFIISITNFLLLLALLILFFFFFFFQILHFLSIRLRYRSVRI